MIPITSCNYGSGAVACSPEIESVTIGPLHYDSTSPQVSNVTGVSFHYLTGFTQTLGANGCAAGPTYLLSIDNVHWYYYVPGSLSWNLSNGTSTQASLASVLTSTAMNAFSSQVGTGTLYFKAFLNSNGTQPCEIQSIVISGNQ